MKILDTKESTFYRLSYVPSYQYYRSENRTLSSFLQNAVLSYIKREKGIDYKKEKNAPKPPK
jgi:hypothetical protein